MQVHSNYLENGESWVEFSLNKIVTDGEGVDFVEFEFKKLLKLGGELELIFNWTQESNRYNIEISEK